MRKPPFYGNVPLARKALPAGFVRWVVDRLLSMDEASTIIFGLKVAPGSVSDAMCRDSRNEELVPYIDEDDGDDCDFARVPVDPHIDIRASPRQDPNAIRELFHSVDVAVREDASSIFRLVLQTLSDITQGDSAVATKPDALEHVQVVEETAAASLSGWNWEKTDMDRERDQACTTLKRINNVFMEFRKQGFAQETVWSELQNAQEVASRFEAR